MQKSRSLKRPEKTIKPNHPPPAHYAVANRPAGAEHAPPGSLGHPGLGAVFLADVVGAEVPELIHISIVYSYARVDQCANHNCIAIPRRAQHRLRATIPTP